jgi:hypothetical protein
LDVLKTVEIVQVSQVGLHLQATILNFQYFDVLKIVCSALLEVAAFVMAVEGDRHDLMKQMEA